MSLLSNLRERQAGRFATATPATLATQEEEKGRTVATVATVAVAKLPQGQTAPPAIVGASNTVMVPFDPLRRHCPAQLTADEERAIRAWLALIEETDPATIAEVIGQCQRDADARDYFTGRAAVELPKPDPFPDDRRTCSQCANLRQRVCAIAKPERGALVVASQGYRPDPARLVRCEGYAPSASDPDQQPGAERWPGLREILQ